MNSVNKSQKQRPKKVLIAAGGTGGHVFPGIAIADEFISRGYSVEWLGTKVGLESRLVPVHGIKLNYFSVQGIRGRGLKALLLAPVLILKSVFEAWAQVKKIDPDLVIGMGGFVAGPVGFVAYLQRRPLAIHEQNAIPGTTNKTLAKFASATMCAFPVDLKNAEVIGNPIRESLEQITKQFPRDKARLNILIVGGSRGARALNLNVGQALLDAGVAGAIKVRHQCGAGRDDETTAAYEGLGIDVEITPFIDDMDEAMSWADVMICRAGALTVSEIAVVGLPSILVPYPYAIDDHQTENARYLEQQGAAKIVQERDFESGKLVETIASLISDYGALKRMSEAAKSAAKHGAAVSFVERCEALL